MAEDKYSRINWQDQGVIHTSRTPHCKLHSIPIRAVHIDDGFWNPRMEANAKCGISRLLEFLEEHGVVDNFRRLSEWQKVERRGALFVAGLNSVERKDIKIRRHSAVSPNC